LDQARRGTLPGMVRTGATFADAAAEYLRYIEHDRGRKPSTVRGYRSAIAAHLLPAFGELPVASSHSTNRSNRSDLPPDARNRSRAALTWLGGKARTRTPASSSRSTRIPVRALDRDHLHLETLKYGAQRADAVLVMRKRLSPTIPRRPDPRSAHRASQTPNRSPHSYPSSPSASSDTRPCPGQEVPLRMRIDKALNQRLRPVAARGTSPPPGGAGLRQALCQGQAEVALSRRRSRPPKFGL
jgi:Phage integrase, N-terminal SAM-like domain